MLNKRVLTPKQVAASRANGSKSRGPHTRPYRPPAFVPSTFEELGRLVLLEGECLPNFMETARALYDELRPAPGIETTLTVKILLAYWRQTRAWAFEQSSLTRAASQISGTDLSYPFIHAMALQSLGACFALGEYENRYDRQFTRALASL